VDAAFSETRQWHQSEHGAIAELRMATVTERWCPGGLRARVLDETRSGCIRQSEVNCASAAGGCLATAGPNAQASRSFRGVLSAPLPAMVLLELACEEATAPNSLPAAASALHAPIPTLHAPRTLGQTAVHCSDGQDGSTTSTSWPRRLSQQVPRCRMYSAQPAKKQDAATPLHHQAVAPHPLQAQQHRRLYHVSPPHQPPGQPQAHHGASKARPDAAGECAQGARRPPSSPRESDADGLTRAAGQEPRCKGPQRHLGPGE
jgi:hypothetical protein